MNAFDKEYAHRHKQRFGKTLSFLKRHVSPPVPVLDLGPINPFSNVLKQNGYNITNTNSNQDLDLDFDIVSVPEFDLVTAFEIFEHMVSPFPLLKNIAAPKLIASVPLKLWFADAYWNEDDPFDRHYHEFESRQFDMLLKKSGWKIQDSEKWISPPDTIGLRPLFRYFTPRYYIVYCTRI